jgi:hypothetical protein
LCQITCTLFSKPAHFAPNFAPPRACDILYVPEKAHVQGDEARRKGMLAGACEAERHSGRGRGKGMELCHKWTCFYPGDFVDWPKKPVEFVPRVVIN